MSAREDAELDQALDGTLALTPEARRLSRLLEFLDPTAADGLYARVAPWCAVRAGEHAAVFDTATDRIVQLLGATPVLGFDMTDVLGDDAVRQPLTAYLFHLVESLLDGRRVVAWLDEFAKLLGDDGFRALASDSTKTWRKRNGVIAFATQSPSDLLASPIARTVIEQTPTKIFFPNADAHRSDYVDGFGLSEREFELVRTELTPGSRRFLIKQGRESIVVELDLKRFDAELKVISGRSAAVAEMDALRAEFGSEPQRWLPRFLGEKQQSREEEAP